jgi:hypothetical protein
MSQRFISNVALAVAGAVVVVVSQAFTPSVTGWTTFGVSLGALALLAFVQRDRTRGRVQHVLDAATGALALWSAVAAVVYDGGTLTWLSFAEGCGFVALGLVGLIAQEVKTERVVDAFESSPADLRKEELQAAA